MSMLKNINKKENLPYKFVMSLLILMGLYYSMAALSYLDWFVSIFVYLSTHISGFILQQIEPNVVIFQDFIKNDSFTMKISFGCEGSEPVVLFIFAILAFPANWKAKVVGVMVGGILVFGLNILRIIALFYIGKHSMSNFELFHNDIFPYLIIILELGLWVLWLNLSKKYGLLNF